jgi:hypothetical protein
MGISRVMCLEGHSLGLKTFYVIILFSKLAEPCFNALVSTNIKRSVLIESCKKDAI